MLRATQAPGQNLDKSPSKCLISPAWSGLLNPVVILQGMGKRRDGGTAGPWLLSEQLETSDTDSTHWGSLLYHNAWYKTKCEEGISMSIAQVRRQICERQRFDTSVLKIKILSESQIVRVIWKSTLAGLHF